MSRVALWAALGAAVVAVGLGFGYSGLLSGEKPKSAGPFTAPGAIAGPIAIDIPSDLGTVEQVGEAAFAANCAVCHGENAAGSEQGPPLVHVIYEPGHHGDASFYSAAANGVRAHHWRFGNMPAVETVDETEVTAIIAYVRALQRANGIE